MIEVQVLVVIEGGCVTDILVDRSTIAQEVRNLMSNVALDAPGEGSPPDIRSSDIEVRTAILDWDNLKAGDDRATPPEWARHLLSPEAVDEIERLEDLIKQREII